MAKLKITNLKQVQTSIRKRITKEMRQPHIRKGVAEIVVNDIKDADYGNPSDEYYEWRRLNDGLNQTDKKYKRHKINITFTGELLNDLIKNIKAKFTSGSALFVIEHSDKLHKSYKTQKGKTKRASYSKISEGVSRYYDYLKFSDKSQKKVIEFIRKEVFRKLK